MIHPVYFVNNIFFYLKKNVLWPNQSTELLKSKDGWVIDILVPVPQKTLKYAKKDVFSGGMLLNGQNQEKNQICACFWCIYHQLKA